MNGLSSHRTSNGRFAVGNPGGPGRPRRSAGVIRQFVGCLSDHRDSFLASKEHGIILCIIESLDVCTINKGAYRRESVRASTLSSGDRASLPISSPASWQPCARHCRAIHRGRVHPSTCLEYSLPSDQM